MMSSFIFEHTWFLVNSFIVGHALSRLFVPDYNFLVDDFYGSWQKHRSYIIVILCIMSFVMTTYLLSKKSSLISF